MDAAFWIREVTAWSLLHTLWQAPALAALLVAACHLIRSPGVRHGIALAALLLMLAAPVATGVWLGRWARGSSGVPAGGPPGLEASVAEALLAGLPAWAPLLLAWLPILWAGGVLACGIRYFAGWRVASRLVAGASATPPEWTSRLEGLRHRMGVRSPVRLACSANVDVPLLVGVRRPTILLPAASVDGYAAGKLELLLAHELAHVRRRDAAANLVQIAAESMLFFHPAVRWISARIRAEREACCDDLVVSLFDDRKAYARALARAELLRGPSAGIALAVTGEGALHRVRRLLSAETEPPARLRAMARSTVPLLGALLLIAAGALALPLSAVLLAPARTAPWIEVHASDPAGEFGISIARGRVVAATLDGVPLRMDRIRQARDSVHFLGSGGMPLFAVQLTADGIRWQARTPSGHSAPSTP